MKFLVIVRREDKPSICLYTKEEFEALRASGEWEQLNVIKYSLDYVLDIMEFPSNSMLIMGGEMVDKV